MKQQNYLTILAVILLILIAFFSLSDWQDKDSGEGLNTINVEALKGYDSAQFQPLPVELKLSQDKVSLGDKLFNDTRLSQDNSISCESCHHLYKGGGGIDGRATSIGINGATGNLNAPTVFNSGFNSTQFWDGRAATLEEQVAGPIHNPIEMASSWHEILPRLSADNKYQTAFRKIYPKGITADTIADAIATFERSLFTPNSRFDYYLRGNKNALSDKEHEGFLRFKEYGCASCHQGLNLGGNMFQRFGVFEGYFDNKSLTKEDLGRYNVTQLEQDRYVFKVPSLRNVAVTAPYLHDGSAKTLEEVVLIMGIYQLGQTLSDEDVEYMTAFLGSLTGEWQGEPL